MKEEERQDVFASTACYLCTVCTIVAALAAIVTFTFVPEGHLTTVVIKGVTLGREKDTSRSTIPAPTLTETEIVPSKTTMSAITKGSPPIAADRLVCTVGKTVTDGSKYPQDGLCDYIFFESISRKQRVNLTAFIFDRHLTSYFKHVERLRNTKPGMSFSIEDDSLFVDYLTPGFTQSLEVLWQRSVYHFGMLNIYGPKATRDLLQIMKVLQTTYNATSNYFSGNDFHIVTVVGLAVDFKFRYDVIAKGLGDFVPSLIILHTHVSFQDRDRPDCRILPASMLDFPVGIPRDDFGYGTSVEEAASFAQILRTIGVPVTISFTMRARIYAPRDVPSDGDLTNELFKPCTSFVGLTDVFLGFYCGVFGPTFRYLPGVEATFAFRTGRLPQIITFETEGVLIHKVCAAAQYLGLPFPIAVYDVEKDDEGIFDCTAWNISRKSFSRLEALGRLRRLLSGTHYYTTYHCLSLLERARAEIDEQSKAKYEARQRFDISYDHSAKKVGDDDETLSSTLDPPGQDVAPYSVKV